MGPFSLQFGTEGLSFVTHTGGDWLAGNLESLGLLQPGNRPEEVSYETLGWLISLKPCLNFYCLIQCAITLF